MPDSTTWAVTQLCVFLILGEITTARYDTEDGTSKHPRQNDTTDYDCHSIISNVEGNITSPGYPHRLPKTFMECDWTIRAPNGQVVVLDFLIFDLPGMNPLGRCVRSYLMYGDFDTTKRRTVHEKLCGKKERWKFISSKSLAWIVYISAGNVLESDSMQLGAFWIKYSFQKTETGRVMTVIAAVCGGLGLAVVIATVVCCMKLRPCHAEKDDDRRVARLRRRCGIRRQPPVTSQTPRPVGSSLITSKIKGKLFNRSSKGSADDSFVPMSGHHYEELPACRSEVMSVPYSIHESSTKQSLTDYTASPYHHMQQQDVTHLNVGDNASLSGKTYLTLRGNSTGSISQSWDLSCNRPPNSNSCGRTSHDSTGYVISKRPILLSIAEPVAGFHRQRQISSIGSVPRTEELNRISRVTNSTPASEWSVGQNTSGRRMSIQTPTLGSIEETDGEAGSSLLNYGFAEQQGLEDKNSDVTEKSGHAEYVSFSKKSPEDGKVYAPITGITVTNKETDIQNTILEDEVFSDEAQFPDIDIFAASFSGNSHDSILTVSLDDLLLYRDSNNNTSNESFFTSDKQEEVISVAQDLQKAASEQWATPYPDDKDGHKIKDDMGQTLGQREMANDVGPLLSKRRHKQNDGDCSSQKQATSGLTRNKSNGSMHEHRVCVCQKCDFRDEGDTLVHKVETSSMDSEIFEEMGIEVPPLVHCGNQLLVCGVTDNIAECQIQTGQVSTLYVKDVSCPRSPEADIANYFMEPVRSLSFPVEKKYHQSSNFERGLAVRSSSATYWQPMELKSSGDSFSHDKEIFSSPHSEGDNTKGISGKAYTSKSPRFYQNSEILSLEEVKILEDQAAALDNSTDSETSKVDNSSLLLTLDSLPSLTSNKDGIFVKSTEKKFWPERPFRTPESNFPNMINDKENLQKNPCLSDVTDLDRSRGTPDGGNDSSTQGRKLKQSRSTSQVSRFSRKANLACRRRGRSLSPQDLQGGRNGNSMSKHRANLGRVQCKHVFLAFNGKTKETIC